MSNITLQIEADRELVLDINIALCHRMERLIAAIGESGDLDESVDLARKLVYTHKQYKGLPDVE